MLTLMCMFCMVNCYTCRICLSHALTVMVIGKNKTSNASSNVVCEPDDDTGEGATMHKGEYEWSEALQGQMLAFFFAGYLITHLPGGILADKYGGKWVLIVGMLLSSLSTVLTPVSVYVGDAPALITIRLIMGLGQGVVFPALSGLLASWVPAKERSILGSIAMSGAILGSILGNSLSGLLLKYYTWPVLFYFFGVLSVLWVLFFFLLCFSFPYNHPYIKEKELTYLIEEMGERQKKPPIPWCGILKNCPTWAFVCAQVGHNWGFFVMVIDLPKYMGDVLRMNVVNNGLFSSLPWLVYWITSIIMGFVGSCLITRDYLSITNVRKLMTAIAAFGPGIFMVIASYFECNKIMVVASFTICMATMGPYMCGMKLTPLDMSPNFAGLLTAISNGIGSIAGYVALALIGLMTPNSTIDEWRLCFWLSFFMLAFTAIIYCIWASGEVQPFDSPEAKEKADKENQEKNPK